jgi:hypothetical protein
LSEQGADRCLADHFIANGHSIIQVLNGKPRCAGAKHTFVTPCDLARELKAGFTPFH